MVAKKKRHHRTPVIGETTYAGELYSPKPPLPPSRLGKASREIARATNVMNPHSQHRAAAGRNTNDESSADWHIQKIYPSYNTQEGAIPNDGIGRGKGSMRRENINATTKKGFLGRIFSRNKKTSRAEQEKWKNLTKKLEQDERNGSFPPRSIPLEVEPSFSAEEEVNDDAYSGGGLSAVGIEFPFENFVRTMSGLVSGCSSQSHRLSESFENSFEESDDEDRLEYSNDAVGDSLGGKSEQSSNLGRTSEESLIIQNMLAEQFRKDLAAPSPEKRYRNRSSRAKRRSNQNRIPEHVQEVVTAPMSRFIDMEEDREDVLGLSFLFPDNSRAVRDRGGMAQMRIDDVRDSRLFAYDHDDDTVDDDSQSDMDTRQSSVCESSNASLHRLASSIGEGSNERKRIRKPTRASLHSSESLSRTSDYSRNKVQPSNVRRSTLPRSVRENRSTTPRHHGGAARAKLDVIDPSESRNSSTTRGRKTEHRNKEYHHHSPMPRPQKKTWQKKLLSESKKKKAREDEEIAAAFKTIRKHAKVLGVGEQELLWAIEDSGATASVHSRSSASRKSYTTI